MVLEKHGKYPKTAKGYYHTANSSFVFEIKELVYSTEKYENRIPQYSLCDTVSSPSYLAATLFEPTFARAAFPCFDEPAMKAKFSVTIIRRGKYTALSNMPIIKTVRAAKGNIYSAFQYAHHKNSKNCKGK